MLSTSLPAIAIPPPFFSEKAITLFSEKEENFIWLLLPACVYNGLSMPKNNELLMLFLP